MIKTIKGSENYQCQVIKLPVKLEIKGLDNLVEVNHQGNSCLIGKESDMDIPYLFFPVECIINHTFLSNNNLYRHSELNREKTKKGFFEDNRRVKALKFKGIISSGFIIPLTSLQSLVGINSFKVGDEFNSINNNILCEKYIRPSDKKTGMSNPRTKVLDSIIDSKFAPEHPDTSHLMKNLHKLNLDDYIAVTYKLHGTSARYYNTLVKRKLSLLERVSKFFGAKIKEESYEYVSASRRVIKGVGFETLADKIHYYNEEDLWSKVGKEVFEGKLNQGESVYCEIIGKTYSGQAIQHGYSYQLEKPKVYIYRIANINSQGIEVDLSYHQMKDRALQLGIEICPEYFYGKIEDFVDKYGFDGVSNDRLESIFNRLFYDQLLEQKSILDNSVFEEGFCIRKDGYPKCETFKIKSKNFLLHEGKSLDKEITDIEQEESL